MFIKKKIEYFETLPQIFSLEAIGKYHLKPAV